MLHLISSPSANHSIRFELNSIRLSIVTRAMKAYSKHYLLSFQVRAINDLPSISQSILGAHNKSPFINSPSDTAVHRRNMNVPTSVTLVVCCVDADVDYTMLNLLSASFHFNIIFSMCNYVAMQLYLLQLLIYVKRMNTKGINVHTYIITWYIATLHRTIVDWWLWLGETRKPRMVNIHFTL